MSENKTDRLDAFEAMMEDYDALACEHYYPECWACAILERCRKKWEKFFADSMSCLFSRSTIKEASDRK